MPFGSRTPSGTKSLVKRSSLDQSIGCRMRRRESRIRAKQCYSAGIAFGSIMGAGASAGILLNANRNAATIA